MKTIRLPHVPFVDTRSLESYLAAFMVGWGCWLLLPFKAYGSGFVVLAGVMPEGWCGAIAVAVGSLRVASIVARDYVRATSVVSAMFWGGVAAGFAAATPRSPAVFTFTAYTIAHLFIVARSTSRLHARRRA